MHRVFVLVVYKLVNHNQYTLIMLGKYIYILYSGLILIPDLLDSVAGSNTKFHPHLSRNTKNK